MRRLARVQCRRQRGSRSAVTGARSTRPPPHDAAARRSQQQLFTSDTELADDLSELLQKHQKQLNELDWNSREMYARMLSDHEPLADQIGEFCSILCDTGKAAKKALKNRKKKAAKKKKAKKVQEQRGSSSRYGRLLKQAKQSKVLFPGV